MVGSEDPLQFYLKGMFVQDGSSGTHFDYGQIKIKPPLFMPHPNRQIVISNRLIPLCFYNHLKLSTNKPSFGSALLERTTRS